MNKTIYINYVDQIDLVRVKNIIAIVTQILASEKPDCLYFIIASPGGSVDAGIALYNYLKSLPLEVIMHNIGSVDSIANVIFSAGKRRYAAPHSTFLFHGVQLNTGSPLAVSLPQISEMRDRIVKNHKTIAGIICENTDMQETEIIKLFAEGETKDTDWALEKGLIHGIKLLEIPKNASIVTININ